MSWDRAKYEAAPWICTDISTPDYRGSESPLGMCPNIAFHGTPWGWELLVPWRICHCNSKSWRVGAQWCWDKPQESFPDLFGFFFHFTTTGHPTGLLGSCKIPINHANILLLLSLSPCPFFLHSSTINRAKWIFFFLICREK